MLREVLQITSIYTTLVRVGGAKPDRPLGMRPPGKEPAIRHDALPSATTQTALFALTSAIWIGVRVFVS